MASYRAQNFEYPDAKGDTVFYAVEDEHNHEKSVEFSKACIAWLVKNVSWPKNKVRAGKGKR